MKGKDASAIERAHHPGDNHFGRMPDFVPQPAHDHVIRIDEVALPPTLGANPGANLSISRPVLRESIGLTNDALRWPKEVDAVLEHPRLQLRSRYAGE